LCKIDGGIKFFHNKQKLKQYMTMKPLLQKILRAIQNMKTNKNMKGWEVLNHKRRKDK
jgi:hypothetical protein